MPAAPASVCPCSGRDGRLPPRPSSRAGTGPDPECAADLESADRRPALRYDRKWWSASPSVGPSVEVGRVVDLPLSWKESAVHSSRRPLVAGNPALSGIPGGGGGSLRRLRVHRRKGGSTAAAVVVWPLLAAPRKRGLGAGSSGGENAGWSTRLIGRLLRAATEEITDAAAGVTHAGEAGGIAEGRAGATPLVLARASADEAGGEHALLCVRCVGGGKGACKPTTASAAHSADGM